MCVVFAGAAAKDAPVLLVLGDSLSAAYGMPQSQGWVSLLEKRLEGSERPWQVINASITGGTTGQALKRLPRLLGLHRPKMVIIELGGNDGLQGKPLAAIRENLEGLIRTARDGGARPALIGMRIPPNYGEYYAGRFEQLYGEVAEQENIPLLRFNFEELARTDGLMQSDGIHPAPQAQTRMLDSVWPVLESELLSVQRGPAPESQGPD